MEGSRGAGAWEFWECLGLLTEQHVGAPLGPQRTQSLQLIFK